MRRGSVRTWLSPLQGLRIALDVEMDPGAKQEFACGSTMACGSYTSLWLACTETCRFRKLSGNSGTELWVSACPRVGHWLAPCSGQEASAPATAPADITTCIPSPPPLCPSALLLGMGTRTGVLLQCLELTQRVSGCPWGSATLRSEVSFQFCLFPISKLNTRILSKFHSSPPLLYGPTFCLSGMNQWFKTEVCVGAPPCLWAFSGVKLWLHWGSDIPRPHCSPVHGLTLARCSCRACAHKGAFSGSLVVQTFAVSKL